MTAPETAERHGEDLMQWAEKGYAVHNPHGRLLRELPVIYGFNNGGRDGTWFAQLVAEDGTPLGVHICSSEAYMPSDLGILEGSSPNRHEGFRSHYPDGYRMDFVPWEHPGVQYAIKLYRKMVEEAASKETTP